MEQFGCSRTCLNGGFCTSLSAHIRSSICKCAQGYHGSSCEVKFSIPAFLKYVLYKEF